MLEMLNLQSHLLEEQYLKTQIDQILAKLELNVNLKRMTILLIQKVTGDLGHRMKTKIEVPNLPRYLNSTFACFQNVLNNKLLFRLTKLNLMSI